MKGLNKLSHAAKYRKARHLTDSIASLCSEPGMTIFKERYQVLQQLYDSWRKGEEVKLVHSVATVSEIEHALVMEEASVNVQICEEVLTEDVQVREELSSDVALNEEEPVAVSVSTEERADVEIEAHELRGVSKMDTFGAIEMPPVMRKRGRLKGSETTVIGLSKKRQRKRTDSSTSRPTASMCKSCAKCGLYHQTVLQHKNQLHGFSVTTATSGFIVAVAIPSFCRNARNACSDANFAVSDQLIGLPLRLK